MNADFEHEPIVSSVASWLADARDIQQRLAAQAAKDVDHAYYRWLAEQLLEKLAGAQRALDAGAYTRSLNREPLEGMLMLEVGAPLETDEASTTITFRELQSRGWFGHAEQLP